MKICLIPTSAAGHLARSISAKSKGFKIVSPDLSRDKKRCFPDGEIYMRISKVAQLKDKRIVVLHSGAPGPNEGLMELELVLQILRDGKVNPEVFFSYFPYGMQDKVFEKGETNAAENLIKKLINFYRVKKIYIIDPHFGGKNWAKKYPIINISAVPILTEKARRDFGKNVSFFSPDVGSKRRTKISGFKKKRWGSFNVKIFSPKLHFEEKIVAVVDDMIKTGGTLLKFYEIAQKSEAKKTIALVTHGVISKGISKVKKKYSGLYLTNTIKQSESNVDITDLILKTISNL